MPENFDEITTDAVLGWYHRFFPEFGFCMAAVTLAGIVWIVYLHLRQTRCVSSTMQKIHFMVLTFLALTALTAVTELASTPMEVRLTDFLFFGLVGMVVLYFIRRDSRWFGWIIPHAVLCFGLLVWQLFPGVLQDYHGLMEFKPSQRAAVYFIDRCACFQLLFALIFTLILCAYTVHLLNVLRNPPDPEATREQGIGELSLFVAGLWGFGILVVILIFFAVLVQGDPISQGSAAVHNHYVEVIGAFRGDPSVINDPEWMEAYEEASGALTEVMMRPFERIPYNGATYHMEIFSGLCDAKYEKLKAIEEIRQAILSGDIARFERAANYLDLTGTLELMALLCSNFGTDFTAYTDFRVWFSDLLRKYSQWIPLWTTGIASLLAAAAGWRRIRRQLSLRRAEAGETPGHRSRSDSRERWNAVFGIALGIVALIGIAGLKSGTDFYEKMNISNDYLQSVSERITWVNNPMVQALRQEPEALTGAEMARLCDGEASRYIAMLDTEEVPEECTRFHTALCMNLQNQLDRLTRMKEAWKSGNPDSRLTEEFLQGHWLSFQMIDEMLRDRVANSSDWAMVLMRLRRYF